jgi:hypothetical protein
MLSLWKLRVGAEAYYLSQVARGLDDYYTGQGEMPGRWLGNATFALGLSGVVTGEDLRAVMASLSPRTGQTSNGERLRVWRNRVPGFDLTFSAPKSVSVLYALADPLVRGQVVEALDAAVDEALGWLEREACFVRVNGHPDRPVGGRWFSPWTVFLVPQGRPRDSPRSGQWFDPFPSAVSVRRTLSPVVTRTWAWCMSRSTRAEAIVRGMSSSKPEGCRLLEMATVRRS